MADNNTDDGIKASSGTVLAFHSINCIDFVLDCYDQGDGSFKSWSFCVYYCINDLSVEMVILEEPKYDYQAILFE
jgi:hypothetical protein